MHYNGAFLDAEIVPICRHYLGTAESGESRLHCWRCPRCKVGTFHADGDAGTAGCTRDGCAFYGSVDAVQTIARFEGLNPNTQLRDVLRQGKRILNTASGDTGRGDTVEGPGGPETATVPDESAPVYRHGRPETAASPEPTAAHGSRAAPGGQRRGPSPEEIERILEEQAERRIEWRIDVAVEKAHLDWWEWLAAEEEGLIKLQDKSVERVLKAYSWATPVELLVAGVCFWSVFVFSHWLVGAVDGPFLFLLELVGVSRPEEVAGQRASLWDGLGPFFWKHYRALISTAPGACFSVYVWRELARERRQKARLKSKQYVAILKSRRWEG